MTPRSELHEWLLDRTAVFDRSGDLGFRYLRREGVDPTLDHHTLMFNSFLNMTDPAEKDPMVIGASGPLTPDAAKRALDTLHKSVRIICITQDTDPVDPAGDRGWRVSRMWQDYSTDSGACLILSWPDVRGVLFDAGPRDLETSRPRDLETSRLETMTAGASSKSSRLQ